MHYWFQKSSRHQNHNRQALQRIRTQLLVTLFGLDQFGIMRVRGSRMRLRQIRCIVLGTIHVASSLFRHMLSSTRHHFEGDFGLKRSYVLQNLLDQIVNAELYAAGM